MTIFVDKVRGPEDDDFIWQTLLSFRLQKFKSPSSGLIVDSPTVNGAFGTLGPINLVIDSASFNFGGNVIWDFSSSGAVPVGSSRVYLLAYSRNNFPISVPLDIAENPDGLDAEGVLLAADNLFSFGVGVGIGGVFVIPNGGDVGNAPMSTMGTLFQGFPPGYIIGMQNRRFELSDWVDVHLL